MLESLWNKYIPTEDGRPLSPPPSPVDIQKKNSVELLGTFTHNWKYQSTTHEVFYEDHRALARSIYGLAIYAGDVVPHSIRKNSLKACWAITIGLRRYVLG